MTFLVDTGATLVSIPEAMADRLGLVREAPIGLQTAAGPVQGYLTRLEEVRLGDIVHGATCAPRSIPDGMKRCFWE